MKKATLLIILPVCIATSVYAQKVYLTIGAGYGLPAAPGFQASESDFSGPTESYKIKKGTGSFGKGIQLSACGGYLFNEHIATELGISYLLGSTMSAKHTGTGLTSETTIKSHMLRIMPGLRISAGNKSLSPYAKMGLVIGIIPKLKSTLTIANTTGASDATYHEYTYSGGISIGFTSALGLTYRISNSVRLYTEVNLIAQSWAPEKMEVTKYTQNNQDMLPTLSTSERVTEFVDEYSDVSNPSSPSKSLKTNLPFSSIGLTAGIYLALGKRTAHDVGK